MFWLGALHVRLQLLCISTVIFVSYFGIVTNGLYLLLSPISPYTAGFPSDNLKVGTGRNALIDTARRRGILALVNSCSCLTSLHTVTYDDPFVAHGDVADGSSRCWRHAKSGRRPIRQYDQTDPCRSVDDPWRQLSRSGRSGHDRLLASLQCPRD